MNDIIVPTRVPHICKNAGAHEIALRSLGAKVARTYVKMHPHIICGNVVPNSRSGPFARTYAKMHTHIRFIIIFGGRNRRTYVKTQAYIILRCGSSVLRRPHICKNAGSDRIPKPHLEPQWVHSGRTYAKLHVHIRFTCDLGAAGPGSWEHIMWASFWAWPNGLVHDARPKDRSFGPSPGRV